MRGSRLIVWLAGFAWCVSALTGCARPPIWDTTQGVPTYVSPPGPLVTSESARQTRIVINPAEQVVPVGSEVALIASVCVGGQMAGSQPVNWSLEGAGELRGAGGFGTADGINPIMWPQKTSPTSGQSNTLQQSAVVTRGTQTNADDFVVQTGQTWMSLSSAQEGTSIVTATASTTLDPSGGQAVARVHWVDAQWTFPQSTNVSLGSTVPLTTVVTRATTSEPIAGYLVRYEVSASSGAGFAPDGATSKEIPTDNRGQATVELMQTRPATGTVEVQVQVIRDVAQPAPATGGQPLSPRVVLGRSSLAVSWTSDVTINLTGPSQVPAGTEADFTIDVANPGQQVISGATVTMNIPPGWEIVGTDPIAQRNGNRFTFDLKDLEAGAIRNLAVRYHVTGAQALELCAELNSTSGARVRDCVRTGVSTAAVSVSMRRLQPTGAVRVGDQVTWQILVRNGGNAPTPAGLVVNDAYDSGLQHEVGENPIAKDLESIPPGQSIPINVTFTAVAPGRACQRVTITNEDTGQQFAETSDCVDIARDATPARREIAIRKTGPLGATIGDHPKFQIEVTNTGQVPLRNVRIVDTYDTGLRPVQASEGSQYEEPPGQYRLTWIVDQLGPGQFARFDVECVCERVADRVCGRATVAAEDGTRDEDEVCVDIRSDKQALSVTVSENADPVARGNDVVYTVEVKNNSTVTETQVLLNFELGPGLEFKPLGTFSPRRTGRDFQQDGNTIRFNPMAEIRPGETARYTIRTTATQAGSVGVRAVVTGGSLRGEISVPEATTINANRP